jgi:succinate-acetate transporter protein
MKKGGILMAHMASPHEYRSGQDYQDNQEYRAEGTRAVASPLPLGLLLLAFTTALVGASFARFLIPTVFLGVGTLVAPMLIYGGIILVLAGMWAFRRTSALPATLFSAYGGFLVAFGVLLLPTIGLITPFGADVRAFNHTVGLLFLCWAICCAVLFVAALRTSVVLMAVLGVLCLAYLFMAIGEFANGNGTLLAIGGWLAIICALLAWYEALASILRATRSPYQVPTGEGGELPFGSHQQGYGGREPAV